MKVTPLLTAIALSSNPLTAGVIFTDTFSGSGSPDPVWVTDTSGDSTVNATVSVSGGALNVNTDSVEGLAVARHTLELTGSGAPVLTLGSSWTVQANMTLADGSAFATMAGGEGVALSFGVRNNLPSTDDRAQINFAALNFAGGPDFAVRGAHVTAGAETGPITNLGAASAPLTATMRMAYDAGTGLISFGADTGVGFFELVTPVDTSVWSMTASDPLLIQLELGMAKFDDLPADSTFSIEDGEATINSFTIFDEVLATNTIPEPGTLLLSALGMAGLVLRRRR
ncbi:PEP-CTERM sorting domain-containing protein [Haloferula sp. A504]|uniref:PEP-CTERM sorting domain-containing protein n=1 Tax=Haloferula sp. A504 TaxID=3373601 RepID=UPI0031C1578C|nr:PEP-CTERM sorting domain-containing protein [Verrucomicrobiaceae bacterium E54]